MLGSFALSEAGLDERVKRRDGFLGVGSAGLDFQPGSALGSQSHEVQDALAIGPAAFAKNPDL